MSSEPHATLNLQKYKLGFCCIPFCPNGVGYRKCQKKKYGSRLQYPRELAQLDKKSNMSTIEANPDYHIFFPIPKNMNVRKHWEHELSRWFKTKIEFAPRETVCSVHFDEEDISRKTLTRVTDNGADSMLLKKSTMHYLNEFAVPTRFPGGPDKCNVAFCKPPCKHKPNKLRKLPKKRSADAPPKTVKKAKVDNEGFDFNIREPTHVITPESSPIRIETCSPEPIENVCIIDANNTVHNEEGNVNKQKQPTKTKYEITFVPNPLNPDKMMIQTVPKRIVNQEQSNSVPEEPPVPTQRAIAVPIKPQMVEKPCGIRFLKVSDVEYNRKPNSFEEFAKDCAKISLPNEQWSFQRAKDYKFIVFSWIDVLQNENIAEKRIVFSNGSKTPKYWFDGMFRSNKSAYIIKRAIKNACAVEDLIYAIDSFISCPGTGHSSQPFSAACHVYMTKNSERCKECDFKRNGLLSKDKKLLMKLQKIQMERCTKTGDERQKIEEENAQIEKDNKIVENAILKSANDILLSEEPEVLNALNPLLNCNIPADNIIETRMLEVYNENDIILFNNDNEPLCIPIIINSNDNQSNVIVETIQENVVTLTNGMDIDINLIENVDQSNEEQVVYAL